MKEFLSQNNINFNYIEITDSMLNLKTFLKYRDNHSQFEEIREKGRVGIPCIMINNGEKFLFEDSDNIIEELKA